MNSRDNELLPAASELVEFRRGRADFEAVVQRLRNGEPEQRRQAAAALWQSGSWSIEPLCRALEDADQKVRIAAAESLEVVGDERAIGPLTRALRACHVGHSARRQTWMSVAVFGTYGLIAAVLGASGHGLVAIMPLFAAPLGIYVEGRVLTSRRARPLVRALAAIAERRPSLEMRSLLPELGAMAGDPIQERETRRVARTAAQQILSATERLKMMPLPSEASAALTDALPRPAEGPTSGDPGRLPRATETVMQGEKGLPSAPSP